MSRVPLLAGLALLLAACAPAAPSPGGAAPATGASAAPAAISGAPSPTSPPPPVASAATHAPSGTVSLREFAVPAGSRPHDVAPAADGGVWYTAQATGELGWLDPATGRTRTVKLGAGSAPHGVITGPDGAAWITDGGLNAIVRVDPHSDEVRRFPLPAARAGASLNTAVFDGGGTLWFTGQSGVFGRLDPRSGEMAVFDAPLGPGPYGIASASAGLFFASLAGSYVGRVEVSSGRASVLRPPTGGQGARRVWPDSRGRVWVSEWNAGQVAVFDPVPGTWQEWKLPGARPAAYAVYVDDRDIVWVTDFGANALVRFDPETQRFSSFPFASAGAEVRQLIGRPGEVWGAMSAVDRLMVATTR